MSSGSMVTSSNKDFIPGRKLLVHVAENGHSLEFECDGSTLVEAIQRSMESLCGVHMGDQLLLCRNTTLDSHQQLSYYKLPLDDHEVFLYNKARLLADAPHPPPEAIDAPEPVLPSSPSSSQYFHPLDNAPDPASKALISYERQFRYHFQLANAVYVCTQTKYEICKRLLREQQVQEKALETARKNLEHTYRKLQQRYSEFIRCFSQQHRGHADLLAYFDRDVDRLRKLKLHPKLQTETYKSLFDLVKEDNLNKCVQICFSSHQQFEVKVSHLKAHFEDLRRKVESLFSLMTSSSLRELEHMIRDHQKILSEQKSIMQSLSKDVNTAKKLVDNSDSQLSVSLRPHDAVSALGRIYDVHEKSHIPDVQHRDLAMSKLLDRCKCMKNEMNLLVHDSMQKVKFVQYNIKERMNELHAFQEVMGHQEKEFENLKFVSRLGHAYRACLAEVVRRKSSLKLYMGMAGQLAERVAVEREAEMRKREEFYKAWGKYIPHDILASMGLFDSPSQFNVDITPFDRDLLDIDMIDIDRYAPQSLLGISSKSEKNAGNPAIKSDEDYPHSNQRIEFQDIFGGFESVDIAGTNKLEVENACLKSDLATAIAIIATFQAQIGYDSFDEGAVDNILKTVKEQTAEALHLKDEYAKHLESIVNKNQVKCLTYEKRIQELEQRLSDQYMQGQKIAGLKENFNSSSSAVKDDDSRSYSYGDREGQMLYMSSMPMDEVSSMSGLVETKLDTLADQASKPAECGDDNTTYLSRILNMQPVDSSPHLMDATMLELPQAENEMSDIGCESRIMTLQSAKIKGSSGDGTGINLEVLTSEDVEPLAESKVSNNLVLDLQNALAEKSNQCNEMECKLKVAMEEVNSLRRELEVSRNLLDESQMNCAQLENCLHEAREEARTNLCAADRRASEYNALQTTAVKLRSLFEMLRSCITVPGGVSGFADSLQSLALSLSSSISEDDDDSSREFETCVKVLSDKVDFLARHRAELLEHCSSAETEHANISRELEEKKKLIKNLYTKHQLEKQANKEKINFSRFEVHELAAFVLSSGNYEAVNRNCPNFYLSEESVALFTEQQTTKPAYIIGQIVHIERQTVRAPTSPRTEHSDQTDAPSSAVSTCWTTSQGAASNPYNLPIGCEYYKVTVAMLPDTILSRTS